MRGKSHNITFLEEEKKQQSVHGYKLKQSRMAVRPSFSWVDFNSHASRKSTKPTPPQKKKKHLGFPSNDLEKEVLSTPGTWRSSPPQEGPPPPKSPQTPNPPRPGGTAAASPPGAARRPRSPPPPPPRRGSATSAAAAAAGRAPGAEIAPNPTSPPKILRVACHNRNCRCPGEKEKIGVGSNGLTKRI